MTIRGLELTVDLDADLNLGLDGLILIVLRPLGQGQEAFSADALPHFLAKMRSKRAKQLDEDHEIITADCSDCIDVVDQSHQACNRGIELHRLNVSRHLFDRLVEFYFHIRICRSICHNVGQTCHTLKETLTALYRTVVPRELPHRNRP